MKKLFSSLCALCFVLSSLNQAFAYTNTDISSAEYLANENLIVKQSSASAYRLDDTITRAEVIGIALKMKGATLPDDYFCKNYFSDVKYDAKNNWICRAMEIAADEGIISKSNAKSRPQDTVSFTEAMAMISDAQCLIYKKEEFGNFYTVGVEEKNQEYDTFYSKFNSSLDGKIPAWELKLITGFHVFNGYKPESKINWLHRKMTRGEVFTLIMESRNTNLSYMLGCKGKEINREVLSWGYEKDMYNVYHSDIIIPGIDPKTFKFYENDYISDKSGFYKYFKNIKTPYLMPNIDKNSFTIVDNNHVKDNNSVYYCDGFSPVGSFTYTTEQREFKCIELSADAQTFVCQGVNETECEDKNYYFNHFGKKTKK